MGGGSKTTTTNENQQATTTPQTPAYALGPVQNYFAGIDNYQRQDPYSLVTPANDLQNTAFQNASGLFQTGDIYGQAINGASSVLNAAPQTYTAGFNGAQTANLQPATLTGATGYQPANVGQASQVTAPYLGAASTYNPATGGQAATYSAPSLGTAAQAGSQGYDAANLGQAGQSSVTGYQAPQLGNAQTVNLQGYNTASLGNAAQASPVNLSGDANKATAASLLDNLSAYQNPYTQQVVNTSLADQDHQAAIDRAALEAQGAKAGAFGGSRFGIAQSSLLDNQERARAATDAQLRSSAFNAAAGLSQSDAGNRQQTSLFNAGAQNQREETSAGLNAANSQFNAGQQNQFGLARFDAQNAANQFGANAANTGALANQSANNQFGLAQGQLNADAGQFNAAAQNANSQFNTGQKNQFGIAQGQLASDAAQFGANAYNQNQQFNAGQANDFTKTGAGLAQQAGLFNAGAANDFSLANQNALNQAGQFNAGQQNQFAIQGAQLGQTAALANQSANNQFGLAQAGYNNDASQFNAGAQNAANLANMNALNQYGLADFGAQNELNQFNAGQANSTSQFNTGQLNTAQQQQLARQMQAAGLLGDLASGYGSNYRADLGSMSDLGNQLYNLQNVYNQAPLAQLQNVGNLLNPGYLDALSSKTVTGSNSGVSQEKSSGGLFNALLGIASVGAPFISDRRAKEDIRRIGKTDGGLPVYTFRYKGDPTPQMGVMAQDVEKMQPEALGPVIGGFKSVLYAQVH